MDDGMVANESIQCIEKQLGLLHVEKNRNYSNVRWVVRLAPRHGKKISLMHMPSPTQNVVLGWRLIQFKRAKLAAN